MEEQLISFETAKLAKEKKFNSSCSNYFRYWYNEIQERHQMKEADYNSIVDSLVKDKEELFTRPTQSLLQKWLREVHDIIVLVNFNTDDNSYFSTLIDKENTGYETYTVTSSKGKQTYEEAMEAGLKEGLIHIKKQ